MHDDLLEMSAGELAAAIGTRQLGAPEAVHAMLAQIETYNPTLNAMCTLNEHLAPNRSSVLPHCPQIRSSPTGLPHAEQEMMPSLAYSTPSIASMLVFVPTVERGLLWRMMFCCTATVGPMPDMVSNLSSSAMPASLPKDCKYCLMFFMT